VDRGGSPGADGGWSAGSERGTPQDPGPADSPGQQGPCADECALGATRSAGGKAQTCRLFSAVSGGPVQPSGGTRDRARRYDAWIRKHHLAEGGLNSAAFTDTSYAQVAAYYGARDSALFGGAYVAAEALRVKATGSPEAQAHLQLLVENLHRLFEITGSPGVLARYAAPLDGDPHVAALYDPKNPEHHKTTYQGRPYFWIGNASRDAHQGPLLAYGLAYSVLTSEAHRALIRKDILALCTELLKARKQLAVVFQVKVAGTWLKLPLKADLQYVVLSPAEFVDGSPTVTLGTDEDPMDIGASTVMGLREFFPDYSVVVKQIPILSYLGGIPFVRSDSTIMLASILRLGMKVSEGVPQHASQHAAIAAHYQQQFGDWLGKMKQSVNTNKCWGKYYGFNIGFMPVFNLIQLESDPARRAALQAQVLDGVMWPVVQGHKNPFFTLIHASHAPAATAQAEGAAAAAQLAGFPPPPNAGRSVDLTGKYPPSTSCENQTQVAIDVAQRNAAYFLWEKHPFEAKSTVEPVLVFPGSDYLIAYWLGRAYGLIADDAPGTCLRWLDDA